MRSPPPKGKLLLIGSEDVEVYPQHCGDGHKCIQCYFNGKYLCSPRFWLYPTLEDYYNYPVSTKSEVYGRYRGETSLTSMDRYGEALQDRLAGQPLIPMPDGGFVAEATERVNNIPAFRKRQEPSRITDISCNKCGYHSLGYYSRGSASKHYRDTYRCPQCGAYQIQDTQRKPYTVKPLLRELSGQGLPKGAIIELIQQKLGVRLPSSTYKRYVRELVKQ